MNSIFRIYCRMTQAVFRAVMPHMPYRVPEILSDISDIARMCNERGFRSLLIVASHHIREHQKYRQLLNELNVRGIKYSIYYGTESEPTVNNVREAREIFIENGCEAIIAVGGGSVIDCAKCTGAVVNENSINVCKLAGLFKIRNETPFFIAVPTTAGSGSESTLTCVITDEKNVKYTVNSFRLIPDCVLLEAELLTTVPRQVIANTGMDALTHAVEAYIGRSTSKKVRFMCIKAIRMIIKYLPLYYDDPENIYAIKKMQKAAFMSGCVISRAYVGYVHSIAHTLGGKYGIPHGYANAVLLPVVLKAYGSEGERKLYELAVYTGIAEKKDSPKLASDKFTDKILEMNKKFGIPIRLPEIKEDDIPVLAYKAQKEANPLYPVPRLLDEIQLTNIYKKVMVKK